MRKLRPTDGVGKAPRATACDRCCGRFHIRRYGRGSTSRVFKQVKASKDEERGDSTGKRATQAVRMMPRRETAGRRASQATDMTSSISHVLSSLLSVIGLCQQETHPFSAPRQHGANGTCAP